MLYFEYGQVAQLDRVCGYELQCRGFESLLVCDIIYNRDLFSRILEEGGRVLDSIDDSVLCINKTDLNIPVSVSFSSASRVIFSISAQVGFRFLVLNKSF